MRRVFKWMVAGCGVLMSGMQTIRPARTNPQSQPADSLQTRTQMPPPVAAILERACQDCHSNETRWPWYSQIAPVSWFVANHVGHGRRHLNFSEWSRYDAQRAAGLLASIADAVNDGWMPLSSYTLLHRDARLSEADARLIRAWVAAERQRSSENPLLSDAGAH
jgi:hypothetical protein